MSTAEDIDRRKNDRGESVLRFSAVVASGIGGRPKKFPLDWASVKSLYASLAPREKEGLGLQVS